MTQLEYARKNKLTPLMSAIARQEGVAARLVLKRIAEGTLVIPANIGRSCARPCGIGKGLRVKVNANIGTSTASSSLKEELRKLAGALDAGTDTIMDLSVGGNIPAIRAAIMKECPVPLGTVPLYEIAVGAQQRRGDFLSFTADDVLDVLAAQAKEGVDFFTIHSGITRAGLGVLRRKPRVMDIVSRGGAMIAGWMHRHKKENPFYEKFDTIVELARRHDVTLSLGDGLRPGSILDATDAAQVAELKTLGELARRAQSRGVQVMIEGPGHVPLPQIKRNIELQKKICRGAPFYVLGPLVTDSAAGYDHIAASIGGALAAWYGADFLCYVTPAEHLRLPSADDVREGVIASRIAAHAADIAKGIPSAIKRDTEMSKARRRRDWKGQIRNALDPVKARQYHAAAKTDAGDTCTMCGEYCSIKVMGECKPEK